MGDIFTIGAYGFTEETFRSALIDHQIETFCDIRMRRGVRGSLYRFVNKTALCSLLSNLGIEYVYSPEFAPTLDIRSAQHQVDASTGVLKRDRTELSPAFIESYRQTRLALDGLATLASDLKIGTKNVVLFCVERQPQACHRSLVAEALSSLTGVKIQHILP